MADPAGESTVGAHSRASGRCFMFFTPSENARTPERCLGSFCLRPPAVRESGRQLPLLSTDPAAIMPGDGE